MLLDAHTLTFCEQVLGEIYPPPPKWQLRKLCHDDDSLAQEHFVLNVRTFDDRPQPAPAQVSDKGLLHNKNFVKFLLVFWPFEVYHSHSRSLMLNVRLLYSHNGERHVCLYIYCSLHQQEFLPGAPHQC